MWISKTHLNYQFSTLDPMPTGAYWQTAINFDLSTISDQKRKGSNLSCSGITFLWSGIPASKAAVSPDTFSDKVLKTQRVSFSLHFRTYCVHCNWNFVRIFLQRCPSLILSSSHVPVSSPFRQRSLGNPWDQTKSLPLTFAKEMLQSGKLGKRSDFEGRDNIPEANLLSLSHFWFMQVIYYQTLQLFK